jgi:hypothetical protein
MTWMHPASLPSCESLSKVCVCKCGSSYRKGGIGFLELGHPVPEAVLGPLLVAQTWGSLGVPTENEDTPQSRSGVCFAHETSSYVIIRSS